jgi:hypothetical protein
MIGQFQVWNKKENRPATNNDVYDLQFYGYLKLVYDTDTHTVCPIITDKKSDFEIREVKE